MTKIPQLPSREAFHEAGHATMAVYLDLSIATVAEMMVTRLRTDEVRRVLDEEGNAPRNNDARIWEKHIVFCLGGEYAERVRAERHPGVVLHEEWWARDRADLVEYAIRAVSDQAERDAYLRWLELRARNILRNHWLVLEAVAKALMARPKSDGETICEIWNATTAPTLPPELLESLQGDRNA